MSAAPPRPEQSAAHIGLVLRQTLAALGMSQAELARQSGLSTKHVNQVINGGAALTDATALAIGEATGIPAEIWIVLDAMHRMQQIADPAIRTALTRPERRRAARRDDDNDQPGG